MEAILEVIANKNYSLKILIDIAAIPENKNLSADKHEILKQIILAIKKKEWPFESSFDVLKDGKAKIKLVPEIIKNLDLNRSLEKVSLSEEKLISLGIIYPTKEVWEAIRNKLSETSPE